MEVKEISREVMAAHVYDVQSGVYTMPNETEDLNWLLTAPNLKFYYIDDPEKPKKYIDDIFIIENIGTPDDNWRIQNVKWWIMSSHTWSVGGGLPEKVSHLMYGFWCRLRYLVIEGCSGYDYSNCVEEMSKDLQELKEVLEFQGSDFS